MTLMTVVSGLEHDSMFIAWSQPVEARVHEGRREPGVSGSREVGRPGCVSLHSIFRAVCLGMVMLPL